METFKVQKQTEAEKDDYLIACFHDAGFINSLVTSGFSIVSGRKVEIFFVYQNPLEAWDFTKRREEIEQRKVSREVFISAFIRAQENVNQARQHFGDKIELNILIKDFKENTSRLELNKTTVDPYLKRVYTKDELEKLII